MVFPRTSPLLGRAATLTAASLTAALLPLTASGGAVTPQGTASGASVSVRDDDGTSVVSPRRFSPSTRAIFNDPSSAATQFRIRDYLLNSIRATPKGAYIRIATYQFDSDVLSDALLNAHRRGVEVQVIVNGHVLSDSFARLQRRLAKDPRSFAKKCRGSCRGSQGWAHNKFLTITRSGKARDIVMYGSGNLAHPATLQQWNNLTSVTGSKGLHDTHVRIFQQMRRDRPLKSPWANIRNTRFRSFFYPAVGVKPEPILRHFNKVRCKGTTNGAGTNGRTKIRIAIAGWFDAYGTRIARRVRQLWDRGCDVKVVNTLTGRGINRHLRAGYGRGPVPTRELTKDSNGDGYPEWYLHHKYFTIEGIYEGRRDARLTFTGAPNWSERSLKSDENLVRMSNARIARDYANEVDRMYRLPWAHGRRMEPGDLIAGRSGALAHERRTGVDVSKLVEQDW